MRGENIIAWLVVSVVTIITDPITANNQRISGGGSPCSNNPCGAGARCEVRGNNNVICSCPDGLQGDPLISCEAECYRLEDCPFDKQCQGSPGKCIDPCTHNVETGQDISLLTRCKIYIV